MAGPTVKEILLKFGIDNSNWKKAIQELSTLLDTANKNAAKQAASAEKSLAAQKQKIQEIKQAQKEAAAVIDKQIAQQDLLIAKQKSQKAIAEARLASEKANAAEAIKQRQEKSALLAAEKVVQAEVNTRLLREKLLTAEINKQTASIRQQAVAARAAARKGGEGGGGRGFGGGLLGTVAGGLFGGGPFGMIAGAVASAEGFTRALELALEKLKEFSKEVGPLQQVREQFEKLAAARGVNDPVKFIGDLREATHGLVNDMQLYRNANTFMQSSIHASNDDIIQLTKATVGLARAQGRDATEAVQSLQRFFLTGRSMTLAYATGINRAYLQVGQLGQGTDAAIKTQVQFKQALEAVTEQYKLIGEPAETYTEKLEKVGVASYRVLEEFMLGLENSKGFQVFLNGLDTVTKKLGDWAEKAVGWGDKVGALFSVSEDVFTLLKATIDSTIDSVSAILDTVKSLFEVLSDGSQSSKTFIDSLFSLKGIAAVISASLTLLTATIKDFATDIKWMASEIPTFFELAATELLQFIALATGSMKWFTDLEIERQKLVKNEKEAWNKAEAEMEATSAGVKERFQQLDRMLAGQDDTKRDYKIKFAAPAELFTEQQRIDAEKKYAKIKEQIAIETSKIELEQTKMRIANEQELVKVQYDQGLMTHAEFLSKKRTLDKQEIEARLKDANTEYAAKAQALSAETRQTKELAQAKKVDAELDRQTRLFNLQLQKEQLAKSINEDKGLDVFGKANKLGDVNDQYNALVQLVNRSYAAANRVAAAELAEIQAKELVEAKKHQLEVSKIKGEGAKQDRQITEEEINDEIAARKKLIDTEEKLEKAAYDRRNMSLEKGFREGLISSNDYLAERTKDIEDEYQASVTAANKKLEQDKLSQVNIAEFNREMADASIKREKELTALTDKEWDLRVQSAQRAADRVNSILQSQLKYQEEIEKLNPQANRSEQIDVLQQLITLEQKRLEVQQAQVKAIEDAGLLGSETWTKVYAEIGKTQTQLLQYNEQLLKARDYSNAIADAAKKWATVASLFPKGGHVSEAFNKFAQITETLSQLRQSFQQGVLARHAPVASKTPADVYKALEEEGKKASGELRKSLGDAGASVGKYTTVAKDAQDNLTKTIKGQTEELKEQTKEANLAITATQQATKATQEFTSAIIKAANGVSGVKQPATGQKFTPFSLSGPSTPSSPIGTLTDSDVQDLNATMSSGVPGQQGAAALAASLAALVPEITTVTSAFQKLGNEFTNILGSNGLLGGLKQMFGGGDSGEGGSANEKFANFMGGVQTVAGGIGGMMSAAKGTGGPMQAGMTGMSAGMQLGSMIPLPGAPIIGAGIGLITGVLSGKAEKESEKIAKQIVAKFNAVLDEVNTGTKTLASGVQAEIANIQSAVDSLSGRKGGRDQLKKILPDMEAKLQQLKDQQKQVITSFDTTLEQLRAPEAYRETVGQVQQIIQKYQDYVNAGGNVAQANQFLQLSFQTLVQNGIEQLNQAEENAINNALNYNDLLLQRQDLIQSTNQQIQSIMSQGVSTRQTPEGVQRAIEIQKLMRTASEQMDKLNEEISVSNHKLNVEQKIFGLATTRIGLETQLIALQDAQADKDDKQALALQQVVAAYSSAVPTNLSTALTQLGLGGAFVPITSEQALMPVAPVKTGVADVDLQNQLEYQQALQYYQQQTALGKSSTSTIGSLGVISGMGVTAGDSSTLSTFLNGAQSLPQALQQLFQNPSTVVNVASAALTSIAKTIGSAIGIDKTATFTPTSSSLLTSPIQKVMAATVPTLAARAMTQVATQTNSQVTSAAQRIQIESGINQLSDMRIANESALTKMKMQEIQADMQRVAAHMALINAYGGAKGSTGTLEDMLQTVYETRGRQGYGRFYGEIANPT